MHKLYLFWKLIFHVACKETNEQLGFIMNREIRYFQGAKAHTKNDWNLDEEAHDES